MNDLTHISKLLPKRCPICGTHFTPRKDYETPTCGNPNCVREARARGLPFASRPTKGCERQKKAKKPKKDKPQKPKAERPSL